MKKNQGATTIVIVCVMAIIMALSLGLLLSASVLLSTSQRTLAKEQCRILAVSYSDEVTKELTGEEFLFSSRVEEESARVSHTGASSLWFYVKDGVMDGSFPYYDEAGGVLHNEANAIYSFTMEPAGTVSEVGTITLQLYWEPGEQERIPKRLTVLTTATVKEQSCTITDTYLLQATGGDYSRWVWTHEERR